MLGLKLDLYLLQCRRRKDVLSVQAVAYFILIFYTPLCSDSERQQATHILKGYSPCRISEYATLSPRYYVHKQLNCFPNYIALTNIITALITFTGNTTFINCSVVAGKRSRWIGVLQDDNYYLADPFIKSDIHLTADTTQARL